MIMYQVTKHPSGITVATAEMPHMASASLGIWVGVGGRYEPAALSGVSHFIEHMLFKGTKKRSAKEISETVEGGGGYLNAFTTEENTCFYAKGSSEQLPDLWDVLSDMFLNSTFDPGEVEKERNVIREELAMYLDQPHHHVQDLLDETLWPDQPLGRPLTGTEETLARLNRSNMLQYLRANYVSGSTIIAAAGKVSHRELLQFVSKRAGKVPKAKRRPFQPAKNEQCNPRIRLCTKPTEQTQLALGIRTCSRHDERRYALKLLNVILGENMSSRLFQVVREEHGMAYSICSSLSYFDDVGALIISAGTETARLERTLKLVAIELSRLAQRAPTTGELRRARDYVIGQLDLSLENTENQMMWMGEHLLGYGRIFNQDEIKQRLHEITPAEVRKAARDFFAPERLSLALVSPIKKTTGLESIFRFII